MLKYERRQEGMVEDIRMDSHKLIYHPKTVTWWLRGENVYSIEIGVKAEIWGQE